MSTAALLELCVLVSLLDWHSAMAVSLQDWHSVKTGCTGLTQCQDWLYRPGTVSRLAVQYWHSVKTGCTGLTQCQDWLYRTDTVP